MKVKNRRQNILNKLAAASAPISAGSLAEEFGVSRQIIVKDIAALREDGYTIDAMTRGYILKEQLRPRKVFKVIHTDEDVETELNLIVDMGGCVEDVFIYHKFYNQIKAPMHIKSRYDVAHFLKNIAEGKSSLLKNVTAGYHYHTVVADDEDTLKRIEDKLWEHGFLAPLQEYEPSDLNRN
ncbi:MAG: transcription repressor NadR [Clostridia bacterium]|nr:transcription repressor NadR [Clostridia bacterium]